MQAQSGRSLIGNLLLIAGVVVAGYVGVRVIPVYTQHYSLLKSVKSVQQIPKDKLQGTSGAAISAIKQRIKKQFIIDDVRDFSFENITVKRVRAGYKVILDYSVTKPLFENIDLLFHFKTEIKVDSGE